MRRDERCGGFTKQQRRAVAQHLFNYVTEADFRLLARRLGAGAITEVEDKSQVYARRHQERAEYRPVGKR